jgi:AraC family transcriptional regulator of adaptative response / DNA-3-methyladenine glycosylase II
VSPLDPRLSYRALQSRDARFDGRFFVGVTSTRIYCRPICPATTPREDRCRFFASAAAAERRGFRPCLRCRPELAPGDGGTLTGAPASVDAVATLARTAAARITAGALDGGTVAELAAALGVSDRHLRRAVDRELGASPSELAQTRRLLTAKQLLTDTSLSMTRVAQAAGFSSLRRFNALFQQRYRLAPSALRRSMQGAVDASALASGESITLTVAYRPPYDWEAMLGYFALRATAGVEWVTTTAYWRTISLGGVIGAVRIGPSDGARRRQALQITLTASLLPVLVPLLARLRRLLDLDGEPQTIAAHLAQDAMIGRSINRRPGLRVPGAFDGTELAVRTVLGQQVSVRGANTLAARLVQQLATPLPPALRSQLPEALTHLSVSAAQLVAAGAEQVAAIGMPRARATALVGIADAVQRGGLPELVDGWSADPEATIRRLRALPGIGDWTAHYIAMRALRWPDAFPDGDLVLRQSAGGVTARQLRALAESWRPWRAYAAQHLWSQAGTTHEE